MAGLRDPFVGKALSLLHGAPSFNWTIEELAKQVGLSRSVLAERVTPKVDINQRHRNVHFVPNTLVGLSEVGIAVDLDQFDSAY